MKHQQKDKCAIILVRVSTKIQDFEPQINDLIEYAKSKGYNKFKELSTTESGLIESKNELRFLELKNFVENNPEYNTIFATELSRIARKQSTLHKVKDWLLDKKIQLYLKDSSYSLFEENSDKESLAGHMMFTLFGLFAESEMNTKKERFQRAKKQLNDRGYSYSGKRLFGYNREMDEKEGKNKYVINETEAEEIRQIFQWYAYGINLSENKSSIKDIALECKKNNFSRYTFSKRNVNKLLKEEGYLGEKKTNNRRKNPKYLEGESEEMYLFTSTKMIYPSIISKDLFDKVQMNLQNKTIKGSSKHITVLSQILICKDCNRSFLANYRYFNDGKSRSSYNCGYAYKKAVISCDSTYSISMRLLDSSIWSLIKSDLPKIWELIVNVKKDENKIKDQIKNLENVITSLKKKVELRNIKYDSFRFGGSESDYKIIEDYKKSQKKTEKEISELEQNILKLKESLVEETNYTTNNLNDIIINDILNIEMNKERVKEITKTFIKEVKIIYQDIRFVVVDFKLNQKLSEEESNINEYYTKIIIDKRVTQKIRLVKCLNSIQYKDQGLYINDIRIDLVEAFGLNPLSEEALTKSFKRKNPYDLLFKQINYEKLKLYDKDDYTPQIKRNEVQI
jgi:DNA invertase Pin-like site-specific DNA recombinase